MSSIFNLEPALDALVKAFDTSSDNPEGGGEGGSKDPDITQGLTINNDSNVPVINLHIVSVQPMNDTMQGDNAPHRVNLEVSVVDAEAVAKGESAFYDKYYQKIRSTLQKHGWVCTGGAAGNDLENQIELYLSMSFWKTD